MRISPQRSEPPTPPGVEHAIAFVYTNYRGEASTRHVVPERIWFGTTDWHPDQQWFLEGFDLDRGAHRSFALTDITSFIGDTGEHVFNGSPDFGTARGLSV